MTEPCIPIAADDARWQCVVTRQPDAPFVYAVTSTGVYCRPGCPSRRPLRRNVRFFDSADDASRAGFRPCQRCRPDLPATTSPHAAAIARACQALDRAMETGDDSPAPEALAAGAGLSRWHFHRLFKQTVGITPGQYVREKRLEALRKGLRSEATVTGAIAAAGYGSGSRFYEAEAAALGMSPARYRQGAAGQSIGYRVERCWLGWVLIAATDRGVCSIELGDAPGPLADSLRRRFPAAALVENAPGVNGLADRALACLQSPSSAAGLPLDVQGTAFQRRVWMALRQVPAGATTTYSAVAAGIGRPKAVRAVANACAANPVAIVIPCHRVRRNDGGLGGYRWGVARKQALLERERTAAEPAATE